MSTPFTVGATYYAHCGIDGDDPSMWGHTTDGGRVLGVTRARYAECDRYGCRPVVVLDPEDREQVERLLRGYGNWPRAQDDGIENYPHYVEWMQAALRSLIAPPKPPDEPASIQGFEVITESGEGIVHEDGREVLVDDHGNLQVYSAAGEMIALYRSGGWLTARRDERIQ